MQWIIKQWWPICETITSPTVSNHSVLVQYGNKWSIKYIPPPSQPKRHNKEVLTFISTYKFSVKMFYMATLWFLHGYTIYTFDLLLLPLYKHELLKNFQIIIYWSITWLILKALERNVYMNKQQSAVASPFKILEVSTLEMQCHLMINIFTFTNWKAIAFHP